MTARSGARGGALDTATFLLVTALVVALAAQGAASLDYTWQWRRLLPYLGRFVGDGFVPGALLKGFFITIEVAALAAIVTLPLGLIAALLRLSGSVVGRLIAAAYVEIIRNTPMLLQILIAYFVIGRIFDIPRFWCGVLTLAFYEATFTAEIIRGAILAVPSGQREAGRSLGLGEAAIYRTIVLPQALPLMAPPMTSVVVDLVKNSSIVSVIAIFDLTNEARTIIADTFMSFEVWLAVAAIYLSLTLTLSWFGAWLERRLAPAAR